ncbi:MAG: hydroxymethylbilane synthase [Magnetovibrio sp.]|nr:hydroxymethylbilane synthase [Magnetovibrio sp.]
MAVAPEVRIGTRRSPLALAQTIEVKDLLIQSNINFSKPGAIKIKKIKTSGDVHLDRPLAEIGGKGLFTKELDLALLGNQIDIAVHSVKDVETNLPDGVLLAAFLKREDPRDAFISLKTQTLINLPLGSIVGSSSPRRQAQLLHRRPDLKIELLRGNIQTRLKKLANGDVDATILASAGLKRLGLAAKATEILSVDDMLPAVGQGAIGVSCRTCDVRVQEWLAKINHRETEICIKAERALLATLGGSCRTPIGGFAQVSGNQLRLRGMVASIDGIELYEAELIGDIEKAEAIGKYVGEELRLQASEALF